MDNKSVRDKSTAAAASLTFTASMGPVSASVVDITSHEQPLKRQPGSHLKNKLINNIHSNIGKNKTKKITQTAKAPPLPSLSSPFPSSNTHQTK